jgi:hypothetical protein
MDVITKFLEQYSYRFPKGYPDLTDPTDKKLMQELLSEVGINEAINSDSITFENFVLNKYAVEGQTINGLQNLYNAISNNPQKEALFNIIESNQGKSLTSGNVNLNDTDRTLFSLVMQFTNVTNGEPSELWFAMLFKGKAEGGVGGKGNKLKKSDIVSDVSVGDQQISLKNYTSIDNLDFGTLPKTELADLKRLFIIYSTISGVQLNASLTRNSINNLLNKVSSEEFQQDLQEYISAIKNSPIKIQQNFYNAIKPLLSGDSVKEIADEFVSLINNVIKIKVTKVNWWGLMVGGKKAIQNLYLISSDDVVNKLTSSNKQINPAIRSIKGQNLFINGNVLLLNQKPTEEEFLEEDYYEGYEE